MVLHYKSEIHELENTRHELVGSFIKWVLNVTPVK